MNISIPWKKFANTFKFVKVGTRNKLLTQPSTIVLHKFALVAKKSGLRWVGRLKTSKTNMDEEAYASVQHESEIAEFEREHEYDEVNSE